MVVYRDIGRETWSKQDKESLVTRVKEIWSNKQKDRERERERERERDKLANGQTQKERRRLTYLPTLRRPARPFKCPQ